MSPRKDFPNCPQFCGFMKPCRVEGEVLNLEVYGEIPEDVDGIFYRWFNADGSISAFKIKDGSVSFKQRFVRTEKFVREREAQRALLGTDPHRSQAHIELTNSFLSVGKYRNKFTDAVEFKIRTTANTNVVHFNGKLLALKEDPPPYALDPHTLETSDLYDFDGQLPSLTFTARPKFDPRMGEMVCFGYEAKGDGTPDICYCRIAADGKFLETVWLTAPVVAMIHDFAATENWVLFPIIPQVCDIERMKQGGEHWQWSPETPFYIGVLPRRGAKPSDLKNVFFWWPDAQGKSPEPSSIHSQLTRFTIDPKSEELDLVNSTVLQSENSEFNRIDDRFATQPYKHCFFDLMNPALGTDFPTIMLSWVVDTHSHLNIETRVTEIYLPGKTHMVQEPIFIPRRGSTVEGDGYVMALVNNYISMCSELHLLDTREFTKAKAVILLPLRLRQGLHGNWVEAEDL
ncbi:carotenoid oxygenase [Penicillium daleae]|uniref:Carotenoid oxygenase n=1 Tax=Penicillium daleae TaxID=63821 RepID=A0AAD6FW74_9EURO|nr:carotenoid oxygenase [Penicillium daleae]KAJ5432092.1 carotenoid oxygenase [Penicillium daleae]